MVNLSNSIFLILLVVALSSVSCTKSVNSRATSATPTNITANGTIEECDFNNNGFIDIYERAICEQQPAEADESVDRPPLCDGVIPPFPADIEICISSGNEVSVVMNGECVGSFKCGNDPLIPGNEEGEDGDERPPLCEGVMPPSLAEIDLCVLSGNQINAVMNGECAESFNCGENPLTPGNEEGEDGEDRPPLCIGVIPPSAEDIAICIGSGNEINAVMNGGCVDSFNCGENPLTPGTEEEEPGDNRPPLCTGVVPPPPAVVASCVDRGNEMTVIMDGECVAGFLCEESSEEDGPGSEDGGEVTPPDVCDINSDGVVDAAEELACVNSCQAEPEVISCEEDQFLMIQFDRDTWCIIGYECVGEGAFEIWSSEYTLRNFLY